MTTANKLRKYKTYLYDESGKPVIVQLDLRNKQMKEVYEAVMLKLEDQTDWELYEQYKKQSDKETVDFFEAADHALANK